MAQPRCLCRTRRLAERLQHAVQANEADHPTHETDIEAGPSRTLYREAERERQWRSLAPSPEFVGKQIRKRYDIKITTELQSY
jgi:hypothetical protein